MLGSSGGRSGEIRATIEREADDPDWWCVGRVRAARADRRWFGSSWENVGADLFDVRTDEQWDTIQRATVRFTLSWSRDYFGEYDEDVHVDEVVVEEVVAP